MMLRDTPRGLPVSRGSERRTARAGVEPARRGAQLASARRVRTLAFGVIVDPNISRPLPFAGLSYVDFNLFGTGSAVQRLLRRHVRAAGVLRSVDCAGSRWQLAGRAFGIASSYNDRAFVARPRAIRRNIRQRPAHASVWLLRPLTPRLSLRVGYDLDYTHFTRSDADRVRLRRPGGSGCARRCGSALDAQRAGWDAIGLVEAARAAAAGAPGAAPSPASIGRRHARLPALRRLDRAIGHRVSPRLVARVEAAGWAGTTSTGSAGIRSAPSTIGCMAIRRR